MFVRPSNKVLNCLTWLDCLMGTKLSNCLTWFVEANLTQVIQFSWAWADRLNLDLDRLGLTQPVIYTKMQYLKNKRKTSMKEIQ